MDNILTLDNLLDKITKYRTVTVKTENGKVVHIEVVLKFKPDEIEDAIGKLGRLI